MGRRCVTLDARAAARVPHNTIVYRLCTPHAWWTLQDNLVNKSRGVHRQRSYATGQEDVRQNGAASVESGNTQMKSGNAR